MYNIFRNIKLKRHVRAVDKHFTVLNNRYLKVYGDYIEASRTPDPEEMMSYFVKNSGISDGMEVLDAGCGVCGPARYFSSHFGLHIAAITASKLQAEIAVEKNIDAGLQDKISVSYGDFHFLSSVYAQSNFDMVYFFESFCHSYDIHKVILEVKKVLKKGGILYLKDWFLTDRLRNENYDLYTVVREKINQFYSFNFKDGINELNSVVDYLNNNGFEVQLARTPQYEKGDYELTALFHGNNEVYGPNNEYKDNNLIGSIENVFDVIEIFELKAVKQ